MKQIVKQTKFIELYYDAKNRIYSWKFLPETEHIEVDELKETFHLMMFTMRECSPNFVMADDRENLATFSVDIQGWIAEITIGALIDCEVKKFAIVLPKAFINELATEQAVEEARKLAKGIDIDTFTEVSEAEAWFEDNKVDKRQLV